MVCKCNCKNKQCKCGDDCKCTGESCCEKFCCEEASEKKCCPVGCKGDCKCANCHCSEEKKCCSNVEGHAHKEFTASH